MESILYTNVNTTELHNKPVPKVINDCYLLQILYLRFESVVKIVYYIVSNDILCKQFPCVSNVSQ